MDLATHLCLMLRSGMCLLHSWNSVKQTGKQDKLCSWSSVKQNGKQDENK
jgi:hypothetical protein